MLILILFAFISGFVTILAPCIWPLLPVILSSTTTGGKKKPLGITLGVMISFTIFTLAIAYIVKVIPFDTNILRIAAACIIAFLGLTLIIPQLNTFFEGNVSRITSKFASKKVNKEEEFGAGFIIGISLGIVWSPCAGPILAAIATLSATLKISSAIVVLTIAYVLGTGIPLFIFATIGSKIFQKSKGIQKYLGTIQKIFGVVVVLTAIAIATNYDTVLEGDLLNFLPSYSNFFDQLGGSALTNQLNSLTGSSGSLPLMSQAPDFTGITNWLNTSKPLHMSNLRGKVVLVDFWTYTCINCIRTLPHVTAWYNTYKNDGFVVVGVETPEFQFEHDTNNVEQAIQNYGIKYPVAQDNNYATWNAYNNQYWPAEYLIDPQGNIRKEDFGEGEYPQMEQAIRSLIQQNGYKLKSGPTNVPDKTPTQNITSETYLGYNRNDSIVSDELLKPGTQDFSSTTTPQVNQVRYNGTFDIEGDYIVPSKGSSLDLNFYANKVYLVIKPSVADNTDIRVSLDGKTISANAAGSDVVNGYVQLDQQRLYSIVNLHGNYEQHTLHLDFNSSDAEVYVFTFG